MVNIRESLIKGNVADTSHFSEVETEAQGWCYLPGYRLVSDRSESKASTPQIRCQHCWQILSLGQIWSIPSPNTITMPTFIAPKESLASVKVLPGLRGEVCTSEMGTQLRRSRFTLEPALHFLSPRPEQKEQMEESQSPIFLFVSRATALFSSFRWEGTAVCFYFVIIFFLLAVKLFPMITTAPDTMCMSSANLEPAFHIYNLM